MKPSPLKRAPFRWRRKPTRITKDGRLILSPTDYSKRRREVWERDKGRCGDCLKSVSLEAAHIHHKVLRGMASSKRDDRMENLMTLCWLCHQKRHHTPKQEERNAE